jgi:hypothetical protein
VMSFDITQYHDRTVPEMSQGLSLVHGGPCRGPGPLPQQGNFRKYYSIL